MRILIISAEVWRDDTNGGNVLSNIFSGMDAEFAQIFCNPGTPDNRLCKRYYQMTDQMAIRHIFKRTPMGKTIVFPDFPQGDGVSNDALDKSRTFYRFFKRFRLQIFYVAKEILWALSGWRNETLKKFILDFSPDVIFAPCYASHIMLHIDRYVAELTKKPVISYVSDDNYSLQQFRLSPVYWIDRLVLRHHMRKTFPYYRLTYTMTDEQLQECTKALHCRMKILRKGGDFSQALPPKVVGNPIKLIYAGGVYCGRWKTLVRIVESLRQINGEGVHMELHIYTGNQLTPKQQKLLHDGKNSFVHGSIGQKELKLRYQESDIALHVESFEWKYRLLTRLSFSTKIVDCLASGCAVMAICWNRHSGYLYLKNEDAAFAIDDDRQIFPTLRKLADEPGLICDYAQKAWACGARNHQAEIIKKELIDDFDEIRFSN